MLSSEEVAWNAAHVWTSASGPALFVSSDTPAAVLCVLAATSGLVWSSHSSMRSRVAIIFAVIRRPKTGGFLEMTLEWECVGLQDTSLGMEGRLMGTRLCFKAG